MGATVSSLAAGQRTEQVEAAQRAREAAAARARAQVRPAETAASFARDRFELPSPAQSAKAPLLSGAAFRDLSPRDRFEPPSAGRQVNAHLLSIPERSAAAQASTLMTEDASDSKVNCLDRAVDYARGLPEGQRESAELVLLSDNRPGAEGLAGHAVVQRGNDVVDPSSGETYGSTQEYLARNPQYAVAGRISGPDTTR
jgi:hypothetical protein